MFEKEIARFFNNPINEGPLVDGLPIKGERGFYLCRMVGVTGFYIIENLKEGVIEHTIPKGIENVIVFMPDEKEIAFIPEIIETAVSYDGPATKKREARLFICRVILRKDYIV